jgi:hypothetical protein
LCIANSVNDYGISAAKQDVASGNINQRTEFQFDKGNGITITVLSRDSVCHYLWCVVGYTANDYTVALTEADSINQNGGAGL